MTKPQTPVVRNSARQVSHFAGQMRQRWTSVDNNVVFYRECGAGEDTVVLLHGGGSDHSGFVWKHTIPALANRYHVIAPDLPGYGNSTVPDIPPGSSIFDYHIQFVFRFLAKLQLNNVYLCGFSMGGGIALGVALQHPELVKKLVFINGYGFKQQVFGGLATVLLTRSDRIWLGLRKLLRTNRGLVRSGLKWSIHSSADITDELVDDAFDAIRRQKRHMAWRIFQQQEFSIKGFKTDLSDRINKLKVPTLFVLSNNDRLIDTRQILNIIGNIPKATIYPVPNSGHLLPREKPALLNRILLDYLSDNFAKPNTEEATNVARSDNFAPAIKPDKLL
jgi:pimeloyl-ACP methyl ester carboxylesterase